MHHLPTILLINRQLRQVLPSKSRTNMNSTCTSLDNNRLQSRRAPKQAIDPCGHILAHATMYGNTYRLSKRASLAFTVAGGKRITATGGRRGIASLTRLQTDWHGNLRNYVGAARGFGSSRNLQSLRDSRIQVSLNQRYPAITRLRTARSIRSRARPYRPGAVERLVGLDCRIEP